MKRPQEAAAASSAIVLAPLVAIMSAATMLAESSWPWIGLLAGFLLAWAPILQALTHGVGAALRAYPPTLSWLGLLLGLTAVCLGAAGVGGDYGGYLSLFGAYGVSAGSATLIALALMGRAPTFTDDRR